MSRLIELTQGKQTIVDDGDYEWLNGYSWIASRNNSGKHIWYVIRSGNPWLSMHRFIMDCPDDKQVDHVNHDGLDNRRQNLRVATNSLNQHNRRGVKGYQYIGYRKKWKATITVNWKTTHLGYFNTEDEAAEAYAKAKHELVFGIDEDGE